MKTATELRQISKIVEEILRDEMEARNSDDLLYLLVCKKCARANDINLDRMSAAWFLKNRKVLGLPNRETVRRARQKIQHDNPRLSGSAEVEAGRMFNEEIFKAYARSV